MSDIPDLPISPADLGGPAADLQSAGAPAEPDMRTAAGLDAAPEASTAAGADTEAATEPATEPATATREGATPGTASDPAPKAAREMSPGACAELLKQHFPALLLVAQRFIYRQLMYSVVIRAVINAMRGPKVGWGKQVRSGRVETSA